MMRIGEMLGTRLMSLVVFSSSRVVHVVSLFLREEEKHAALDVCIKNGREDFSGM